VSRIDVPEQVRVAFFVPELQSSTSESRRAVPETFSRQDAVFNAGRCALLVRALALEDLESLAVAMQDRWHQPYRARFFPATSEVIEGALSAGAYGAAQSGAGSSVVALVSPSREASVSDAMKTAAEAAGVVGTTMVHSVRNQGASFERSA
jgi:homoserine kinase